MALAAQAFAADKNKNWESGKVLSQDMGTQQAGAYAAPLGTGVVAVPIQRWSNVVVIETASEVMEWAETGNRPVVLPVNGEIRFYREKGAYIVMDERNKKHKFALVGLRQK